MEPVSSKCHVAGINCCGKYDNNIRGAWRLVDTQPVSSNNAAQREREIKLSYSVTMLHSLLPEMPHLRPTALLGSRVTN